MDKPDYDLTTVFTKPGGGGALNEGERLRFARQMLLRLNCFGGVRRSRVGAGQPRGQPDLRTGEDWRLAPSHLGALVPLPQQLDQVIHRASGPCEGRNVQALPGRDGRQKAHPLYFLDYNSVMVEINQTATFRAWERQLRDIETAKALAHQWSQT